MARAPTPKRYAQAVFQIAQEKGDLKDWLEDLRIVQGVLLDDTLQDYLALPRLRLRDKVQVIREVMPDVDPLVQNLVCLLAARLSLEMMPTIVREYERLLDVHHGLARAHVVTAVSLDDRLEQQIVEQIRNLVGMKVVLTTYVDPEMVGGLVIRVGDKVIDGSTRRALEYLKLNLAQGMPA